MSHTGFAWAVHPFFPVTTLRCKFSIYQQSFGGKKEAKQDLSVLKSWVNIGYKVKDPLNKADERRVTTL